MLLFGHLGITLGVFLIVGRLLPSVASKTELRYLALGALLPDIIDKPIGKLIFASTLANGRIIGHTLLFSLFLALPGLARYKTRKDARIISLAAGSFCHLLEDRMWANPYTFFWPLFGLKFPRGSPDYTGMEYFLAMFVKSFEFEFYDSLIFETIGAGVVTILIISSLRKTEKNNGRK